MKIGITAIALTALAAMAFAAPDASGWWYSGPDVRFEVTGSSESVDVDPDTGTTTTIQNSIARSRRGLVHLNSFVDYETLAPYPGCPLVGADATASWVAIYRDGSALTGSGSGFVCWDGVVFTGDVSGLITGTLGRFEGAGGTWEAQASVLNSVFFGTLTGDFD